MSIDIRILASGDEAVLANVAPGVFDHDVDPGLTAEFLRDPRHHLAVALDGPTVVGFASAVDYVHPDKPRELWINEVGVAPSHQRQGLGRRLLAELLRHGTALGCVQAWVLTSPTNEAAHALYQAEGGQAAADLSVLYEFPLSSPGPRT